MQQVKWMMYSTEEVRSFKFFPKIDMQSEADSDDYIDETDNPLYGKASGTEFEEITQLPQLILTMS